MQKLKTKLIIFIFMTLTCFVGVTKAWGDLSIVKPNDSAEYLKRKSIAGIPQVVNQQRKSKAPEPSTLALFGSGFVGMIISFVRRTYALAKRMIDIIGSVVALIVLFPACLFAVFIIKLCSRGSVIYTQTRVGKGGREFKIYKFRTMHLNAEKETGPVWAKETDKRLIPGGQFLRKAHIDEIPQFINVLKGDMSIVGPRPERPTFVKQLKQAVPDYERRLAVKPGITGLAQVWHCYDETIRDVKKKVKYDLLYIRKICFLTDFLIMLRTVRVVFTGEGAR